jgi:hypothetical protein
VNPLSTNVRVRFIDEVAHEGKKATKSFVKDVFESYHICLGVSTKKNEMQPIIYNYFI